MSTPNVWQLNAHPYHHIHVTMSSANLTASKSPISSEVRPTLHGVECAHPRLRRKQPWHCPLSAGETTASTFVEFLSSDICHRAGHEFKRPYLDANGSDPYHWEESGMLDYVPRLSYGVLERQGPEYTVSTLTPSQLHAFNSLIHML
jgi:hypothetical protein